MLLALFVLLSLASAQTAQDCTQFCTDYMATCMPLATMNDIYTDMNACQDECMKYPNDPNCDGTTVCAGNTFGCRRYHLNVAMNTTADPTNPMTHCPHTTPLSSPTANISATNALSGTVCATAVPNAMQNGLVADFCNTVTNAAVCGGYLGGLTEDKCVAFYQHVEGAMDTAHYPDGTNIKFPLTAVSGLGLPCRRYHAQVARADPNPHCMHALFGDDGCGSTCQTYCMLLEQVCPTFYDMATCESDCAEIPEPTDWMSITGKDIGCRIYHMSVASMSAAANTDHCPHASIESTPDTCGESGAATATFSALLIAALAVVTKFSS
jgi:hypothetical protein